MFVVQCRYCVTVVLFSLFRPQVLVLTGAPWARPELVDFVYSLTNKISLMVCGNIVEVSCHHILKVYRLFKLV